MKTISKRIINVFICLLLCIILVLTNFYFWAFNENFYVKEQQNNNVSKVANVSQPKINNINKELLSYLQLRNKSLYINVINHEKKLIELSDREIKHMSDVRFLFKISYLVYILALLLGNTLAYISTKKYGYRALLKTIKRFSALTVAIFVVAIFIVTKEFEYFFDLFHKVLFTNDLWKLNPNTEVLIQILPIKLFTSMFQRIAITTSVSFLSTVYLSSLILNKKKQKTTY